jgi:hypothetical protein
MISRRAWRRIKFHGWRGPLRQLVKEGTDPGRYDDPAWKSMREGALVPAVVLATGGYGNNKEMLKKVLCKLP